MLHSVLEFFDCSAEKFNWIIISANAWCYFTLVFYWTKEEIEQKDMLNILSKESSTGERKNAS